MRHPSDAVTAWELEAERRRERIEAEAMAAATRDSLRIADRAAADGPSLVTRFVDRVTHLGRQPEPGCQPMAGLKPGG